MKWPHYHRLFRLNARICNAVALAMYIIFSILAMYAVFNHEKRDIIAQSNRDARRAILGINNIFQVVEGGMDDIVARSKKVGCPELTKILVDTATRNAYAMMYSFLDQSGEICSSYKDNSLNIAGIVSRLNASARQEGIHLDAMLGHPVFLLSRHGPSGSIMAFIDARYIADLIADNNRLSNIVNYKLTIDTIHDTQLLQGTGLQIERAPPATVLSHSDKYGFGIVPYIEGDLYIIMAIMDSYGWLMVAIMVLSLVAYMLIRHWLVSIDFTEIDIRKGIANHEFIPYLQPVVDSRSQAVIGSEVLVRWCHPVYGLLSPAEFVTQAERSGSIIPMTEWLMALVAEKISVADVTLPPGFTINFNVTLSHLLNPSLKTACEAFLKAFERGDKPRLCLELVERESQLHHSEPVLMGAFRSLQASGVCFAVDDYGTGYSSLKHIHSSFIGAIKIDRLFVQDIERSTMAYQIVMNIMDLADRIGASVIAEGIETPAQVALLRKAGVDRFQGYLYGKPMPLDTFIAHCLPAQHDMRLSGR